MADALHSLTRQQYGYSRVVLLHYQDTVERVKEKLKEQGFGVLAEIDIRVAMKEKLNAEYPGYIILGACHPQLADRALKAEPRLGLLLPCNVIVREVAGGCEVAVVDAETMLAVTDNSELRPIAREASERLQRALAAV